MFFFKKKTAYEMRISDWSSDVCASDLLGQPCRVRFQVEHGNIDDPNRRELVGHAVKFREIVDHRHHRIEHGDNAEAMAQHGREVHCGFRRRSEEHTSELQSLMRISYAVFCLKKKKKQIRRTIKK